MMRSGICLLFVALLAVGSPLWGVSPVAVSPIAVVYAQDEPDDADDNARDAGQEDVQDEDRPEPLTGDYVPGQMIIRFNPGTTRQQISDFYAQHGLAEKEILFRVDGDEAGLRLVTGPAEVTAHLFQVLENDERVAYVEPNYLLRVNRTPNDPDYNRLWGLNNTGQTGGAAGADVRAQMAWDVTTGSRDAVVVVIDTGVDYLHEDLAQNIWVNAAECPQGYGRCVPNGRDDDGNGYIDDFYGVNTITDTGDPMDDFGHGTHVAGTIGAVGNNNLGVAGVNWNVRIVGCKFLGAGGSGTVAGAVKCFQYAHDLKNKYNQNVVATNNSWGGAAFSQALYDAMAGPGHPLHICAAGNSNSSNIHYPAGFDLDNIISVAATDHNDRYASFSNHGAEWVDLAAPGVDIYSTVPKAPCPLCSPSGYDSASGTSMATPHVAGAVSLLMARYPTLTNAQVKQRILSAVDMLADRTKLTMTNGRLNLFNALEDDTTPPATVTDLSVSGVLLTRAVIRWTATGDDGMQGNANAYDIRYSSAPISDASWEQATRIEGAPRPQPPGSTETFTIDGLDPGMTYYVALKVLDNVGNASGLSNVVVVRTSGGTVVFADDMESGPGKWTTEGTDNLWHLSSQRYNSPVTAWYYGKEDTRNYDTGGRNFGMLTSEAISLVGADDVMLTFYEWSQVQSSARLDRTQVQVSTDGNSWETVFESHGTDNAWAKRTVNLTSYITPTGAIHLRFFFDTVDAAANNFEGWYVDDVEVRTAQLMLPGEEIPTANLVMHERNILFNPAAPVAGDAVVVHATVLNQGATDANDVFVQFLDVTGDEPRPIGQPQQIANIPAGGSGVVQTNYPLAVAGAYAIQVVVDPNNFIRETNEADNRATAALTVAPAPMANLVMRTANIGFDPPEPNPGDQVTIRATVLNTGTLEARTVTVQVYDVTSGGTTPVGPLHTIDLLPAGGSHTVEATYDTAGLQGNREIEVAVDVNNAISETLETDNRAKKTLRLTPVVAPNLNVQAANIGFNPPDPVAGDVVTIYATILNDGNAAAHNVAVQFQEVVGSTTTPLGPQQIIETIPVGGSALVQISYNTTNRVGDRRIEVVADPNNFITEIRTTDNRAQKTLRVTPPAAPNLVMTAANVNFSPGSQGGPVIEGDTVTIFATVLNNGSLDAANVELQFIDATGGGALPIGERQIIERIPAGGSAVAQVRYATADKAGDRSIQVVVDPSNFIIESDETDNLARALLRVQPPPAANLVMLANNVEFLPPDPTHSDTVTIHAVVLNSGSVDARNVLVQFIDLTTGEATPIDGEQFIDIVPAGGSGVAQVIYDLAAIGGMQLRDRRIQVVVDSNNLIPETNEGDNATTRMLPVRSSPMPDLVMLAENIGFSPPHPIAGEVVTIRAVVLNQGQADAERVVVQFVDMTSGRPLPIGAEQTIERITVGGSGIAEVTFDTAGRVGEHEIRVLVDPNNLINESSEINNRANTTLRVTAPARANLVMLPNNIGFNPPNPTEGAVVSVTATVLNNGVVDADEVLVQFVDTTDGAFIPIGEKQTIARVPAGGSATTQVTYETEGKVGERKLQVLVDPHTTIPETSDADNIATQTLIVAPPPLPNLVMQENNIGFLPADPNAGEVVTLTATVLNNGLRDAVNVTVQFLDITGASSASSGVPIDVSQVISSIPAGGSAVAQVAYDTTGLAGDRRIQVLVDGANLIRETNETDNTARKTLRVAPPAIPNLVIQAANVGFDPPTPNPGEQVTIYATVLNDGHARAAGVTVQFMDVTVSSAPTPIGQPQTITLIQAGGSGVAQVTYDTAGLRGDRRIQVLVDPNNFIREVRTTDNSVQKTLSLVAPPLPNLVMQAGNIGFAPANPVEGERVTIAATVLNEGGAAATEVMVQFMDATDSRAIPIGEPQVIDLISAGGSGVAQVLYPTTGLAGDRRIQVVVDPNSFIEESRATDNSATRTLTVMRTPLPNLVVLANNIGFNPPAPVEGDEVLVQAVVLNNGRLAAGDVVVQLVDVTGGAATPVGPPQVITVIPAGSSGVAQFVYPTAGLAGPRQLQVVADPNHLIPEASDEDNSASVTLAVAPTPMPNLKLLAGNVKFDPPAPQQGQVVTITATVLNDGAAPAYDVVVQFSETTGGGAMPIGPERTVDLIEAGGSATVSVLYENTEEPGDREIQVTVDPANLIRESDESDNQAVKTLPISPPIIPNLVVRANDIVFAPQTPVEGDPVTVTVTIRNEGIGDATDVLVVLSDVTNGGEELIGDPHTIPTVAAGSSVVISATYDTTGKVGDRRIQVSIDPDGAIEESDKRDNVALRTLRVASEAERPEPMPNLLVVTENISFNPITPTVGSPVTVTVMVSNTGEAPATDVVVEFVDITGDDAEVIGREQITGTLAAGRSGRARIVYDTTGLSAGVRTIQVTADPDGVIDETDDTDNQATGTFTITQPAENGDAADVAPPEPVSTEAALPESASAEAPPGLDLPNLSVAAEDLVIFRADYVAVAAADATGFVTIAATIRNIGAVDVGGVAVQFVVMTPRGWEVLGEQQVGYLPAGENATVEMAVAAARALNFRELRVLVDPQNAIFEADKRNNRASMVIDWSQLGSGE